MRFALLALALAFALLAATVRAEDDVDNADDSAEDQVEYFDDVDDYAEQSDEADDSDADEEADDEEKTDCESDPKTETKTLGGKEISQETENISVNGRCVRVLKGGTPSGYTMAGSCSRCKSSDGHMSCVGSALAMSMKCDLVLGPDCNLHSVDKSDPTKAC